MRFGSSSIGIKPIGDRTGLCLPRKWLFRIRDCYFGVKKIVGESAILLDFMWCKPARGTIRPLNVEYIFGGIYFERLSKCASTRFLVIAIMAAQYYFFECASLNLCKNSRAIAYSLFSA